MDTVLKELWKAPLSAKFGMLVILVYVFIALFAPVLAPYSETEIVGPQFEPWGEDFILGTDNLGRDMLSRLFYGARNTIGIALVTTLLAFLVGITNGFLAAAIGGWMDQLLSRLVDVLLAIPTLIFAFVLLTITGTSILSLILVIALLYAAPVFRISRAVAMNIVVMDFVEVARLRGEGLWWIMRS